MRWQGFIPESTWVELKSKVAKLNKRAAKIGVNPLSLELTGHSKLDDSEYPRVVVYLEIILEGESPKMDGWKLLAVLQHDPNLNANIVKTVPGETIPEDYRTRPGVCDHCGYTRIRKETFVVQHDTSGEIQQVGRQCVADFLGHGDPRRFIKTWEYFDEISGWCEGGWGGVRDDRESFSLVAFVAMSNAVIRRWGWVSSAKSYETGMTSTATEVLIQFNDSNIKKDQIVHPTAEDEKYALEVIEWAKNIPGTSDYEHNLRTIAQQKYVIKKTWGYAASMIPAYKRATEPKVERKVSDFYGTVGDKVNLKLNFLRDYSFETAYGVMHLQKFNDDNGNLFIWGASRPQYLEQGKVYQVTGTIKAHKEYKGVRQTALSRCKTKEVR